jgi:hypothetical protein
MAQKTKVDNTNNKKDNNNKTSNNVWLAKKNFLVQHLLTP